MSDITATRVIIQQDKLLKLNLLHIAALLLLLDLTILFNIPQGM